jgi:hypothetical protein
LIKGQFKQSKLKIKDENEIRRIKKKKKRE